MFENDFITISYGINRSDLDKPELIYHIINPSIFLLKQLVILIPFFIMAVSLCNKFRINITKKIKKNLFLVSITILPVFLILITSIITGAKIRSMWMTPFYIFYGTLFCRIF